MLEVLEAGAIGLSFGWLLQRAGLSRYDRIVGVYRFRDLTVIKFLLSALSTGAVGIRGLAAAGLAGPIPMPATFWIGNLVGGVLFGAGMALSGFCPGTIAAGAGEGRLDYVVPGGLGLVAGALLFGAVYPVVFPVLARGASSSATLAELFGVHPWLAVACVVEVAVVVLVALERWEARRFAGGPADESTLPSSRALGS